MSTQKERIQNGDPVGEWGKQLARDGYSPFTQPVIR